MGKAVFHCRQNELKTFNIFPYKVQDGYRNQTKEKFETWQLASIFARQTVSAVYEGKPLWCHSQVQWQHIHSGIFTVELLPAVVYIYDLKNMVCQQHVENMFYRLWDGVWWCIDVWEHAAAFQKICLKTLCLNSIMIV